MWTLYLVGWRLKFDRFALRVDARLSRFVRNVADVTVSEYAARQSKGLLLFSLLASFTSHSYGCRAALAMTGLGVSHCRTDHGYRPCLQRHEGRR